KHAIIIEPNSIPEGLNKDETIKQLVSEAVHNITKKDTTISKMIQSLNNDIAGSRKITTKENSDNVSPSRINHDEHYQHLAMDSDRIPKEKPLEFDAPNIGEKTR
ncbi:MAG: hypothetical protein ACRDD9_00145, partial [Shewanella sp.]